MTDAERQLVDLYLDGVLPESEHALLFQRLETDPEALVYLASRTQLNVDLRRSFKRRKLQQTAVAGAATSTVRQPRSVWFSWRLLTAAAAGIVFGMLCTSMVWAYAVHERRLSLLRESFEDARFNWQGGFPKQMGQWGGDEAKVVSSDAGVTPKDGARMLKLEPAKTDLFNQTHCIVDLQKQSQALGATTRQIELRASFHPSVLGKKDRYLLRAAAFADGPEKLDERWMKEAWAEIDEHSLAYAARGVSVPAATDGWQTVTLMIDVPPGSRMLVFSMWAATMDGKPANRAAHYLDDVRLSGVINEPLP
jgi:hypothetical protein